MTAATESAVDFPLDTFKAAATHLRRPFTPQAVKFKVQATWPKDGPTGGLVVAYIDARLAVERLNLIVPHLWHDEYAQIDAKRMLCKLTIDGITRQDIGEADGAGKALFSDALKRAAVKFGIGVSLYAIPKMTISVQAGDARVKQAGGKATLEMTPSGEAKVRAMYEQWLTAHGIQAFGEPLSHGDVDDAQGDTEADGETAALPVETHPFGHAYDKAIGKQVGDACVALSGGDKQKGTQLWKAITAECGDYMPQAAAVALLKAANAEMMFPDVKAPELS